MSSHEAGGKLSMESIEAEAGAVADATAATTN